MKRTKRPRIRYPGVDAVWSGGAWKYRARWKVCGVPRCGHLQPTQEAAHDDYRAEKARQGSAIGQLTIGGAVDIMLREARERGVSDVTWSGYESHWRMVAAALGADRLVRDVTVGDINALVTAYLDEGGHSRRVTVRQKHFPCLSAMFRLAGVPDLTRDRRVRRLPSPDKAPKSAFFTPQEVREILRRIRSEPILRRYSRSKDVRAMDYPRRDRDAALVEFVAVTGLRSQEVCRIRTGHVDLEGGVISGWDAKDRDNPRVVELTPRIERLVELLAQHADADGVLIPGGMDEVNKVHRRWSDRLGVPGLTARALRHSFCTAALDVLTLREVADLMGHRRVSTTDRYAHVMSSRSRRRRNAQAVGDLFAPRPAALPDSGAGSR